MSVKLKGTSGSVSLDAPTNTTSGADITFKLPVADGTSGQVLQTDASGQLSFVSLPAPTYGTKTAIGTGNWKDITGIPAGTKKMYLFLDNWSLSGSDNLAIQLGDSGGMENTGYEGRGAYVSNASYANSRADSNAFITMGHDTAGYSWSGIFKFYLYDGNTWYLTAHSWTADAETNYWTTGRKTLSGELTQLRIGQSASSTFDEGEYKLVTFDNL